MKYNSNKYVILNTTEVVNSDGEELIDFSQLLNNNSIMLRYSVDGSKALVKYIGSKPTFLYGKDTYSHAQILNEMNNSEWTKE